MVIHPTAVPPPPADGPGPRPAGRLVTGAKAAAVLARRRNSRTSRSRTGPAAPPVSSGTTRPASGRRPRPGCSAAGGSKPTTACGPPGVRGPPGRRGCPDRRPVGAGPGRRCRTASPLAAGTPARRFRNRSGTGPGAAVSRACRSSASSSGGSCRRWRSRRRSAWCRIPGCCGGGPRCSSISGRWRRRSITIASITSSSEAPV